MRTLPSGAQVDLFETLDSTSAETKRRAARGEVTPLWVVAREQTAGYGRRGRAWESQLGNFAGSLVFRPEGDPADFPQLSFVCAVAVRAALQKWAHEDRLALKWPNDILADGGKIAGLLLERIEMEGAPLVSMGVGVNIASSPQGMAYPTAKLADILAKSKVAPAVEDLLAAVDAAFWSAYEQWKAEGFQAIRKTWLRYAKGIGAAIRVQLPNETLNGYFEGLDDAGALILRQGDGRRVITAGEIMFGDPRAETI
ncbi:MAG: biotin--[acetyl-CoA-carboxylase] ligase [Pseudomonadota bacterium]